MSVGIATLSPLSSVSVGFLEAPVLGPGAVRCGGFRFPDSSHSQKPPRMKSDTGPFALIPEWVLLLSISDRALRLYALLGRYADEKGACWPSRRTLAGKLGCSDDSVDRAKKELVAAGALQYHQQNATNGALTTNLYTLVRTAPTRLGTREVAAGGTREAAAENENHLEREPSKGELAADAAPNGSDPRVQSLVAGYVDDYRSERVGHSPPATWAGACGRAIKGALKDGESVEDISRCLGVIAHEGKHPNTLAYVLGDYHANRPRRMP